MKAATSQKLKAAGNELLWVVGSYVVALLLMGAWLGYATLDIQMHNTYFVFRAADAAVPLATVLAATAAISRLVIDRGRTRYTVAALVALAAAALLLLALFVWWIGSALHMR